jgi:hypothetical protein
MPPPSKDEVLQVSAADVRGEGVLLDQVPRDLVVEVRGELHAPAVEGEVVKRRLAVGEDAERPVVARPGVVRGNLSEADVLQAGGVAELAADGAGVAADDQQLLALGDLGRDRSVAREHLAEDVAPVGVFVRPGELDAALRLPLGGKADVGAFIHD